ncbi:MAG: hypothetical protein HYY65_13570 [Candidatus Tectomicrobia bacterium]|uniref:TlpA family protein disulfide reductase n=1 Tax=Tectimicrobiota bacterium TaxID=2528274 RepID=A0A932GS58_UNCTE|nr:hypothetical protein [Candidatus Tectomicrobia bacterium]
MAFFTIAADSRDTPALVERFAKSHFSAWPHLLGNRRDMSAYKVDGYPITILIDRQGIVRKRIDGAVSYDDLRAEIVSGLGK